MTIDVFNFERTDDSPALLGVAWTIVPSAALGRAVPGCPLAGAGQPAYEQSAGQFRFRLLATNSARFRMPSGWRPYLTG